MADNAIITDNETPNGTEENHQTISPLTSTSTICRTIVRDLCGKYCWDNLILPSVSTYEPTATTHGMTVPIDESHGLPTYKNQPPDADILDKLLQYIYNQSPELAFYLDRTLTDVFPTSALINKNDETAIMRMINEQETSEIDYYQNVQGKRQQNISQNILDDNFLHML
ncbi:unnamed protein product [Didymodactylos carnosus]|uniref:Uncharacterized protein n=1 Tax=Didymodactylos carnosus TaxID=1234261 RepID=A0A814JJV2_9BILA|nr:unnamed protein product [Didymodactylos carnosus]CAF1039011.1 unnamed protein product [Didymodactylos carnosus]CAF3518176.1 unnamed protein product [Didymodactylos carnosus]CAF3809403.1 unnamed protein product [Didymodactylos carnosus]